MITEEFVDIVDMNDHVIGSSSKKEAHEKGLLHRTVIAEIIGKDGRWTLVRQSFDRQDAGQYVSPIGGHVQKSENAFEALKREAFEEFGLPNILSFRFIGKKIFNREVNTRKENHYFILYEIYTDFVPILNHESVGYLKFTKEEIAKELKTNPHKFGDAFHFVARSFYHKYFSL